MSKYIKKAEAEKSFVEMIIEKGGIKTYWSTQEGRNEYYQLELNNGEIRHWTNFSNESLRILGIYRDNVINDDI